MTARIEAVVRWAVVSALGVALAGCASGAKQTENLVDTSYLYQEGLRWQRFDDAAQHVPPEAREDFLDERDQLADDLRIDDYEVTRVRVRKAQSEAIVQVKYTWHLDSAGVVHETVTEQLWRRRGARWLIVSEVRRRGEPMPGVGEAPDADADDAGAGAADGAETPSTANATNAPKPREAPETP